MFLASLATSRYLLNPIFAVLRFLKQNKKTVFEKEKCLGLEYNFIF